MKLKDINFWDITKSLIVVIVVLFVGWHAHAFLDGMHARDAAMQERLITIAENAVKIEGKRADNAAVKALAKEFERENSEILAAFREQKKRTKEALSELGQVKAELKQTRTLRVASDKIYKKESQDPKRWYFFKKITVKGVDGERVPYAWAMFYPYQTPDKQWKIGTYPLEVDTKVIESENRDGTFNRYAEVDVYGKGHREIPARVTDIQWEKVPLKDKRFDWWNPRLAMGVAMSDGPAVGLNLSLMSYGRTERDMDWRFLTFGAAVSGGEDNNDWMLTVEPLSWNAGNALPLVENMFTGPFYGWNPDGQVYGLQVSVPF